MSAIPGARDLGAGPFLAGVARGDPERSWRQFAQAASPEAFCRHWLDLQCQIVSGVNDGVVILQAPGSRSFAPLAFWPEHKADRSRLVAVTECALREGRGIVQPREDAARAANPALADYQLAYPIRVGGQVVGVVGLDIAGRPEAQIQAAVRQLQWGCGWLEVLQRRHGDPGDAARARLRIILQVVATYLERIDARDAGTALVTEIASELGCDRAVLGVKQSGGVRIEAVSHAVQFDRQANLLRATESAMTEALDQDETVVFPPESEHRLAVTFAHAELAQLSGSGGVASFPLRRGDRLVGALTVVRAPGFPFDPPAVELLQGIAAMIGPLLEFQQLEHRGLVAHALQKARGFWASLVGPGHGRLKFAALGTLLACAVLALATGDYRIAADTKIEGLTQRALIAPFNGFVREAAARAGDTVRGGQVLARLDDRDLRVEQARLRAMHEQLTRQLREAMANHDRAQIRIIGAQIEQAAAQLALVEEQILRTDVVAPFDGVLVSGDLSQALGAPLERGQVLFEIAPLDAYRVIVQVDEHRIADVAPGQKGELVLASMPNQRLPLEVKLVTPVTTTKEGRNFFRVEARLDGREAARLRPGMEGVAKISVDERLLVWIWTRELLHWLRLKAWAWTP